MADEDEVGTVWLTADGGRRSHIRRCDVDDNGKGVAMAATRAFPLLYNTTGERIKYVDGADDTAPGRATKIGRATEHANLQT